MRPVVDAHNVELVAVGDAEALVGAAEGDHVARRVVALGGRRGCEAVYRSALLL